MEKRRWEREIEGGKIERENERESGSIGREIERVVGDKVRERDCTFFIEKKRQVKKRIMAKK